MGAGKSSVGRVLSQQLGWAFEDLDERIERREQRKVPEIFRSDGESGFRRVEYAALKEVLGELRAGEEKVVALGGGAFAQKKNFRLIEAANLPTVFLDADVDELWRRCVDEADKQDMERPLLGSSESFRKLYAERRPHYLKAAFRQNTSRRTVEQVSAEVMSALGLQPGTGSRGRK
jgi:shikimate kinase